MTVAECLNEVRTTIPQGVTLVAVSKTHPVERLMEAYEAGQRIFGENRVQELTAKAPQMPPDVEWHLIGHLQRNKVRQVLPLVRMIHSVDSLRLLETIAEEASRLGRTVDCLLEVHIARESTKTGFSPEEVQDVMGSLRPETYPHVRFRGLMGMASFTDDEATVQAEFRVLRQLFDRLRDEHGPALGGLFDTLSMGMSGDYLTAIACGSTMVRVGSAIFGRRDR